MYKIIKNGAMIGLGGEPRYIRMQANGSYGQCKADEAQGVAVDSIPYHINGKEILEGVETVQLEETRSTDIVNNMKLISSTALSSVKESCTQTNAEPKANVGLFIMGAEDWEVGKSYERFDLFRYNGSVGWVKQGHTSQETWLPFSVGTESLYGARPVPDEDGIYPYVYNMKVDLGMKVSHEGIVYECIQGTESLLYAPAQVPALFKVVE